MAVTARIEIVERVEYPPSLLAINDSPPIVVKFRSQREATLDPLDDRTPLLTELLTESPPEPLYVEVDDASGIVRHVLVPLVVKVLSLARSSGGDIDVAVQPSHARHKLRAAHPDFENLRAALQRAKERDRFVMIVETPTQHEIFRVEDTEDISFDLEGEAFHGFAVSITDLLHLAEIDEPDADELFRFVEAARCPADGFARACIPFQYPDDGCHARAHRMCELLRTERGIHAAKVWLFGNLEVATPNHPDCVVPWIYHVAPVLKVRVNDEAVPHVFDPSLFRTHVTLERWKNLQGDPNAQVSFSTAAIWDQPPGGRVIRDEQFARTPGDLRLYRRLLKARIAAEHGPPPYCD